MACQLGSRFSRRRGGRCRAAAHGPPKRHFGRESSKFPRRKGPTLPKHVNGPAADGTASNLTAGRASVRGRHAAPTAACHAHSSGRTVHENTSDPTMDQRGRRHCRPQRLPPVRAICVRGRRRPLTLTSATLPSLIGEQMHALRAPKRKHVHPDNSARQHERSAVRGERTWLGRRADVKIATLLEPQRRNRHRTSAACRSARQLLTTALPAKPAGRPKWSQIPRRETN